MEGGAETPPRQRVDPPQTPPDLVAVPLEPLEPRGDEVPAAPGGRQEEVGVGVRSGADLAS